MLKRMALKFAVVAEPTESEDELIFQNAIKLTNEEIQHMIKDESDDEE